MNVVFPQNAEFLDASARNALFDEILYRCLSSFLPIKQSLKGSPCMTLNHGALLQAEPRGSITEIR
jgi:hypothetical protein